MLRGAIIGFGEVASKGHWPAYQNSKEVEIRAIVERNAQRREAAQQLIPHAATFASVEELVPDEIDFVDICTPPAKHAELVLVSLAKGWNVLCEKPLLLEFAELDQVREALEKAGRVVVPVHNWKYAPIIRRATDLLRSGAIGRL